MVFHWNHRSMYYGIATDINAYPKLLSNVIGMTHQTGLNNVNYYL